MNLLQKICNAVIDTSDAIGASMQGVDVKTHRENLYGHPDGIVAARVAGASAMVLAAGQVTDSDDDDLPWGSMPPTDVALNNVDPLVRSHAYDLEDELAESRWREDDDACRSVEL